MLAPGSDIAPSAGWTRSSSRTGRCWSSVPGTSTAWLARRCSAAVSIETDERWFRTVGEQLRREQLANVDLRFVQEPQGDDDGYRAALTDYVDHEFDFALVYWNRRDLAVAAALAFTRPGGYVFLDNTDLPRDNDPVAKRMLLGAAGDDPEITVFNDVCPGLVMVNEATLVRLPELLVGGSPELDGRRRREPGVVDLERRVFEIEALAEDGLDLAADRVAVRARVDEHVRGESRKAGRDRPDMEVVHLNDARHGEDRAPNVLGGHAARCRLQEDAHGLSEQPPRAGEYEHGDE